MEHNKIELKKGITMHLIKTDKFKTNLISVILSTELNKETVTKNAMIPVILKRGSKNMPTQEELSKSFEEMYGARFDCGIDKSGDNQILKFYIESVAEEYLPNEGGNNLELSINKLLEIVFNPYLEEDCFKKEYVEQEKENLKQIIESKIDNKGRYASDRCIEEMYKNESFGLYKFGYTEDLKNMDEKDLYKNYLELIKNCKVDIFVSGNLTEQAEKLIKENENISNLQEREANYARMNFKEKEDVEKEVNVVEEKMDVAQGKLTLGLDLNASKEQKAACQLYNAILGGSANSKLFQNVREKESLAYHASSTYMRLKNNIFINSGIEIQNYEKALDIIKKQIEDMRDGNFTEKDIENSKKSIIDSIRTVDDEQDSQITYIFGQEMSGEKLSLEKYQENINKVNKEEILDVAKGVAINTIYFLRN